MANHKTGSQRYNDRMDKIFERAKSEERGLVSNSHTKGAGVNSKAMTKAIEKKKGGKKKDIKNKSYMGEDPNYVNASSFF